MQNIQGDTELTLAAAAGNVAAVTSLLEAGTDPGQMNCKGHGALVCAARNGHAQIIRLLIGSLDDKSRQPPKTLKLALAWAASRGHTTAVEVLLDAGAEIDGVTPQGHTALMLAASNGHVDTVWALLQRNASPTITAGEGDTALSLAEQNGHKKVGKYLCRYINENGVEALDFSSSGSTSSAYTDNSSCGNTTSTATTTSTSSTSSSQIYVQPPLDMTGNVQAHSAPLIWGRANGPTQQQKDDALLEAVRAGDDFNAELLLKGGAKVDAKDGAGKPALMVAIDMGYAHVVQVLLDHGAAVDRALQGGWCPFNSAAKAGNVSLASVLLHNGIPIDTPDADGNTCLTLAAELGNYEFVTFLLLKNAKIEHYNNTGDTALTLAASKGRKSTVLELLAHGANILHENSAGMNAKDCAGKNSHEDIKNLLQGAATFLNAAARESEYQFDATISQHWINCVDGFGNTALIIAVKNGCFKNAKLLIQKEAGLDAQDRDGNTALLIAANHISRPVELLGALLSNSSRLPNLRLKNTAGIAIRDLLNEKKYHYPKQRELLLGAFAAYGKKLLEACRQGKISETKDLLKRGADTTVKNLAGNRALHVAAISGNHGMVQLLLDHGAIINVVNEENLTALHLAARYGHIDVVYQLLQNNADPHGIAAALLSEEANAAQDHLSSSSRTSLALPSPDRDIILDLLKFHRYLSGDEADMPVLDIPVDALLESVNDVDALSARPYESLASFGLCRHIIAGLRERSIEWEVFQKAMLAESQWEYVSDGQKKACWVAMLSSLWDYALGPDAKQLLLKCRVPKLTVQRYSRLLKQQVIWLLNTAAGAEKAIFDKMLAFDESLTSEFAQYGDYHPLAHYNYLKGRGMASRLADFITFKYSFVAEHSRPTSISKSNFAKVIVAILKSHAFIQWLDKNFTKMQDDPVFREILNRQIDQLLLACQPLLNGDKSE